MHSSPTKRTARSALTAGAFTCFVAMALPAAAHIDAVSAEVPVGQPTEIDFVVEHGCSDSPTTDVALQIPAGVIDVEPRQKEGWNTEVEEGTLPEPVEHQGKVITTGVRVVRWVDGDLDPNTPGTFTIEVTIVGEVGSPAYFPMVQTCPIGEVGWIQIPEAGQDPNDLVSPAPSVVLVAAPEKPTTPTTSTTTTVPPTTTTGATEPTDPPPTTVTSGPPTTVEVEEAGETPAGTGALVTATVVVVVAAAALIGTRIRRKSP